jgi:hypothetical protein
MSHRGSSIFEPDCPRRLPRRTEKQYTNFLFANAKPKQEQLTTNPYKLKQKPHENHKQKCYGKPTK